MNTLGFLVGTLALTWATHYSFVDLNQDLLGVAMLGAAILGALMTVLAAFHDAGVMSGDSDDDDF